MIAGQLVVMFMIIAIVGISIGGWLLHSWINAKHTQSLRDSSGSNASHEAAKRIEKLEIENQELNDKFDHMQDRLVVLEKIVTERGYSLSEEIEALRSLPRPDADSGTPLNIPSEEART